jgi:hypothetical protein
MRFSVFLGMLLFSLVASAKDWPVEVCFNYGCQSRATVVFSEAFLAGLTHTGSDAQSERQWLSEAIGKMYQEAASQSPIGADKGGNYADEAVYGKMDCIDHSRTTTRFLQLLAARGMLYWHVVKQIETRHLWLIFARHDSAVIEEKASGQRYVVDSWFVDNGQPAVILPLEAWKKGAGPNV